MQAYDVPVLDIELGFGVTIRQPIQVGLGDAPLEPSQTIFLMRRIENILSAAKRIELLMYWNIPNNQPAFAEISVDGQDIVDMLYQAGFFN